MVRIFRHYISPVKLTLALTDLLILTASIFLAEYLRLSLLDIVAPLSLEALIAKAIFPAILVPVMFAVGVYHSESIRDRRIFSYRLVAAFFIGSLILFATAYLFPFLVFWRSILILGLSFGFFSVLICHSLLIGFVWPNRLRRSVVILGSGKRADALADFMTHAPEAGLKVQQIVPLPGETDKMGNSASTAPSCNLESLVLQQGVDLIIVASDNSTPDLPTEALIACKLRGVEILDYSTFYEQVRGYVDLGALKAEWIIYSEGFKGSQNIEILGKRVLDVLVGTTLLTASLPILAVTALLVKISSKGPVLYRQERVGQGGIPFQLLKFRSMIVDAEKGGDPQWAQSKDPRVTRVGRFIRATRIDELPQLVNVLKGEMSFVGPRPERPFFVEKLSVEIPFYKERHCLKPGITGWAQIQYPYGASIEDAKRKLEFDLYYIKNYSLFFDLLIMLQTIRVILFPSGVR